MDFPALVARSEERLFIIGEAGVNHNGDLGLALDLVDAAANAGCDAVKFQTWITEKVYSRQRSIKPDYQKAVTDAEESEFDTIKRLELPVDDLIRIKDHCDRRGILFFSTPDEPESAELLVRIGASLIKTSSQDVTNLPFLRAIGRLGLPVIYSTGASTLSELVQGAEALLAETRAVIILHCVSCYPAPLDQLNLTVIPTLARMFGCPVGLSDHTAGVEAACAAVALGARIFEKHLTLSRQLPGPDHQASLEPAEMAHYVATLRGIRSALGDGHKRVMPCEENVRQAARRFLVAAHDLAAGTILSEADLLFKKVVNGIPPGQLELVVGARLLRPIEADTPLAWPMLGWAP